MRSINKVIEALENVLGDYAGGDWIDDYLPGDIYDSLRKFEHIDTEIGDTSRWSVSKTAIWLVEDDLEKAYLAASWEAPATEIQEGQCTMLSLYEVKPKEVIKTIYVAVK